jgi:predicted esterase
MKVVIPWAEKSMKASPDRAKRFIGGFSNGADLALALATKYPDVFGGALLHSPAVATIGWVGDQAGSQRWVVTGGTDELAGSIRKPALLQKDLVWALQKRGAPVRYCIGRWSHHGRYWRQLSAGSLTWLMQLGDFDLNGSALERGNCKNSP